MDVVGLDCNWPHSDSELGCGHNSLNFGNERKSEQKLEMSVEYVICKTVAYTLGLTDIDEAT